MCLRFLAVSLSHGPYLRHAAMLSDTGVHALRKSLPLECGLDRSVTFPSVQRSRAKVKNATCMIPFYYIKCHIASSRDFLLVQ